MLRWIALFYSGREEWCQFEFFQEERQEESSCEEEEGEEEDIRGVVAVLSQISSKPSKVKPGVSWVFPSENKSYASQYDLVSPSHLMSEAE